MENVFTPPDYPYIKDKISIFLAGSIEMGSAPNWQEEFIEKFKRRFIYADINHNISYPGFDRISLLNPRRPEWDASWEQSIKESKFYQQVDWELEYLDRADMRVFFFAANTLSPITLMELGKFGDRPNSYVCIEEGYKRKGNVDVFCHKFKIPSFNNLEDLIITMYSKIYKQL